MAAGRAIAVVNPATRQVSDRIFMTAGQASSIAVAPDGGKLQALREKDSPGHNRGREQPDLRGIDYGRVSRAVGSRRDAGVN